MTDAPEDFTADEIRVDPILQFFNYSHRPSYLHAPIKPFFDAARHVVQNVPRNAERTVALRKLLEAKDCAVRASLMQ